MATVRYFRHGFIHKETTLLYLQHNHPTYLSHFQNVWKASYTAKASVFADVPYWPPYSTDKFISYVVLGPSQWFFLFSEEFVIAQTQEKTTTLVVENSIILHDNARGHIVAAVTNLKVRFWNVHLTHPIWFHAIEISSPKWKNHCERPDTTQEMNLFELEGGQYGTSTKMGALMVYDAFQTFVKRS